MKETFVGTDSGAAVCSVFIVCDSLVVLALTVEGCMNAIDFVRNAVNAGGTFKTVIADCDRANEEIVVCIEVDVSALNVYAFIDFASKEVKGIIVITVIATLFLLALNVVTQAESVKVALVNIGYLLKAAHGCDFNVYVLLGNVAVPDSFLSSTAVLLIGDTLSFKVISIFVAAIEFMLLVFANLKLVNIFADMVDSKNGLNDGTDPYVAAVAAVVATGHNITDGNVTSVIAATLRAVGAITADGVIIAATVVSDDVTEDVNINAVSISAPELAVDVVFVKAIIGAVVSAFATVVVNIIAAPLAKVAEV